MHFTQRPQRLFIAKSKENSVRCRNFTEFQTALLFGAKCKRAKLERPPNVAPLALLRTGKNALSNPFVLCMLSIRSRLPSFAVQQRPAMEDAPFFVSLRCTVSASFARNAFSIYFLNSISKNFPPHEHFCCTTELQDQA